MNQFLDVAIKIDLNSDENRKIDSDNNSWLK